jgi:uncharacterized repeat protein (TIGR03803 family)
VSPTFVTFLVNLMQQRHLDEEKVDMRHQEFRSRFSEGVSALLVLLLFIAIASSLLGAQTETVVYHFRGGNDGMNPYDTLVADKAGNLYGTTFAGGGSTNCGSDLQTVFGCGTVFELTSQNGHLTETVLYAFTNGSDGGHPYGGLAFDQAGNLYGVTTYGGASGYGTVFQLTPPASAGGAWTENVIYNLTAFNNGFPIYPVLDNSRNVYFEEPGGGLMGIGAVSELSPPATQGGAWTYKQLFSFITWSDGSLPIGTLTLDHSGNLYGVTANGGDTSQCYGYGCGLVFELVRPTSKSGAWTESTIYGFQPMPDGSHPYSGVIFDQSGNLYGTTQQGGVNGSVYGGYGTVYELSPPAQAGGAWTESVLYSFTNGNDGAGPRAAVTRDSHGNLFGTTITPSAFELSPPAVTGDAWIEKTLYNFSSDHASDVYAGLIFRSPSGTALYGATVYGGTRNNGTIFKIAP